VGHVSEKTPDKPPVFVNYLVSQKVGYFRLIFKKYSSIKKNLSLAPQDKGNNLKKAALAPRHPT
jgi:hypothetical protein